MPYKCIFEDTKECLPDIIECENIVEWNKYLKKLYDEIFRPNFIDSHPKFKGLDVIIRKEPLDGEWEHGFLHMTHEDVKHNKEDINDRIPDLRRSERISMVRKIIENYNCIDEMECEKIWYWEEFFSSNGRIRHFLLVPDERFIVILEKAKDVYFVITSFYIKKDWELEKRKRKYERYKKQKTPLE